MTIELLIGSLTLLVTILTLIYSIKENRILIEIVNSKRIHQSLGYLTPNQFEKVSA